MSWTRAEPQVAPGVDVGGDRQVGESYCARWYRPLADGRYAVITKYFYPAVDTCDGRRQADYIEIQNEYLVCTDLTDPGSTEVWADTACGCYTRAETTEDAAKRAAYVVDTPSDDEWNYWAPDWPLTP